MKPLSIIVIICIFLSACKDKPEPNVAALLLGKWKLSQFRQDSQPWKDSTGILYNFLNDSLVSTKRFNTDCDRKYSLGESSEGLKQVSFPEYYVNCYFREWYTFSVVSINATQMEITYPDEVGGVMVRKHQRYLKE